jgi:hypothetical protein
MCSRLHETDLLLEEIELSGLGDCLLEVAPCLHNRINDVLAVCRAHVIEHIMYSCSDHGPQGTAETQRIAMWRLLSRVRYSVTEESRLQSILAISVVSTKNASLQMKVYRIIKSQNK